MAANIKTLHAACLIQEAFSKCKNAINTLIIGQEPVILNHNAVFLWLGRKYRGVHNDC